VSNHHPSPTASSTRVLPLAHPAFGYHRTPAASSGPDLPLAHPGFSRLVARAGGLVLAGTRTTIAMSSLALAPAVAA